MPLLFGKFWAIGMLLATLLASGGNGAPSDPISAGCRIDDYGIGTCAFVNRGTRTADICVRLAVERHLPAGERVGDVDVCSGPVPAGAEVTTQFVVEGMGICASLRPWHTHCRLVRED
jgi:hypothetical protein